MDARIALSRFGSNTTIDSPRPVKSAVQGHAAPVRAARLELSDDTFGLSLETKSGVLSDPSLLASLRSRRKRAHAMNARRALSQSDASDLLATAQQYLRSAKRAPRDARPSAFELVLAATQAIANARPSPKAQALEKECLSLLQAECERVSPGLFAAAETKLARKGWLPAERYRLYASVAVSDPRQGAHRISSAASIFADLGAARALPLVTRCEAVLSGDALQEVAQSLSKAKLGHAAEACLQLLVALLPECPAQVPLAEILPVVNALAADGRLPLARRRELLLSLARLPIAGRFRFAKTLLQTTSFPEVLRLCKVLGSQPGSDLGNGDFCALVAAMRRKHAPASEIASFTSVLERSRTPARALSVAASLIDAGATADAELLEQIFAYLKQGYTDDTLPAQLRRILGSTAAAFRHLGTRSGSRIDVRRTILFEALAKVEGVSDGAEVARLRAQIGEAVSSENEAFLDFCVQKRLPLRQLQRGEIGQALGRALSSMQSGEATWQRDWGTAGKFVDLLRIAPRATSREHDPRVALCAHLSADAAFNLIASTGMELHTSTFELLIGRIRSLVGRDALGAWIAAHAAQSGFLGFMSQLARFNQTELLEAGAQTFQPLLLRELRGGADATAVVARYWRFAAQLLSSARTREQAQALRSTLQGLLDDATLDPARHAAIAFLVRTLYEHAAPLGTTLAARASALPAVAGVQPSFEKWRRDGVINAQLVFYSDEPWYAITRRELEAKGFKLRGAENASSTVLERVRGKLRERVNLVLRHPDAAGFVADRTADIVMHRGHSYHFPKTFHAATFAPGTSGVLEIGGSCGSAGHMANEAYLRAHEGNHLISDVDTGNGAVNNGLLFDIFDAAQEGKTWSNGAFDRYARQGIRFPDDPSHNVFAYRRALEGKAPLGAAALSERPIALRR